MDNIVYGEIRRLFISEYRTGLRNMTLPLSSRFCTGPDVGISAPEGDPPGTVCVLQCFVRKALAGEERVERSRFERNEQAQCLAVLQCVHGVEDGSEWRDLVGKKIPHVQLANRFVGHPEMIPVRSVNDLDPDQGAVRDSPHVRGVRRHAGFSNHSHCGDSATMPHVRGLVGG